MLSSIILATLVPAAVAAIVISLIKAEILGKMSRALSFVATGLLLTISLTHLIPEAMEHAPDIHTVGLTLWGTVIFLIALEMFCNSRAKPHDGTTCTCACHLIETDEDRERIQKKAKAQHSISDPNRHVLNANLHHHDSPLMVHTLRPSGAAAPTADAATPAVAEEATCSCCDHDHETSDEPKQNLCHHGLLDHLGHSHFGLHSHDINRATMIADANTAHGKDSMSQALSHGGAAILAGSCLHSMCDGIVIASSFMVDVNVGLAMTAAIVAHEVPQQLSNYVLMLTFGMSRIQGYIVNIVAAFGSMVGGILFTLLLEQVHTLLPYALAISGGSFIYVALSDILPRLNHSSQDQKTWKRFGYLLLGAALAIVITHFHVHH